MTDHTKHYSKEVQNFMQRHKCLPGITGWAQVNGRDELSLDQKVRFEVESNNKTLLFQLSNKRKIDHKMLNLIRNGDNIEIS